MDTIIPANSPIRATRINTVATKSPLSGAETVLIIADGVVRRATVLELAQLIGDKEGVPSGGLAGQALVKGTDADYELVYMDVVPYTGAKDNVDIGENFFTGKDVRATRNLSGNEGVYSPKHSVTRDNFDVSITAPVVTAFRSQQLQDKNGTIALLADLQDKANRTGGNSFAGVQMFEGIYIGPPNVNGYVIATGTGSVAFESVAANGGISGAGGQLYRLGPGLLDFLRGDQITAGFRLSTNGAAANPVTTLQFGHDLQSNPGYGYDLLQYNSDGTRQLTWKGSKLLTYTEGDAKYNNLRPQYGTIYSNSNFTNLDGLVTNGATASVSAGKLIINGIGGDYTHSLDVDGYTMLPNWQMEATFIVPAITSTAAMAIGVRSTNATAPISIAAGVNLTNGTDRGKLVLFFRNLNSNIKSTTGITFVEGDVLKLTFKRVDYLKWTARVVNLTTANAVDISLEYNSETDGRVATGQNTGKFAIFANAVDQISYTSFNVTSSTAKKADLAIISDSKLGGYLGLNGYAQTLAGKLSQDNNLVHLSAGNDTAVDIINRLPEIINLAPKVAFVDIGRNDLAVSLKTVAETIANVAIIYNALTAAGIKVYVFNGEYETVFNLAPYAAAVEAAYPNNVVKSFQVTKAEGIAAVTADGVHVSDIAHDILYNLVTSSNLVPNVKTYTPGLSSAIYSPIFYGTILTYGGLINLSNTTNNVIAFRNAGAAIPSFTTRSLGTKISLYANTLAANAAEYAMGVAANTYWASVPATSQKFEWYGGITLAATLTGLGAFTVPGIITGSAISPATAQTTIAGSVSGQAIASMPFRGTSFKKVIINVASFNGVGAVYTYPVAFTGGTPVCTFQTTGGTGLTSVTATATGVTFSGQVTNGYITIEGY
jgi:hypothetical protein